MKLSITMNHINVEFRAVAVADTPADINRRKRWYMQRGWEYYGSTIANPGEVVLKFRRRVVGGVT